MSDDYLMHFGKLGMRWGIRRYQNEDGTYTPAGKRRYGMNLDINDKSRRNVAKIRTGEAKRRLDVAKANNETNTTRIAELQGRVRSAKRNEKNQKAIDKGASIAAKGETMKGNMTKALVGYGAARLGSAALTGFLNMRMQNLSSQGRCTQGHQAVAKAINTYGSYAMCGLAGAYVIKKSLDNRNLRAYNSARSTGDISLKRTGSTEYADVVKRRKGE